MKTINLTELASVLSKLTWAEMNYFVSSEACGTSYSRTKADQLVDWADKQLAPEKIEAVSETLELKVA